MGRRRAHSSAKKKKGGVLMGLRGGFRSAVKGATGVGEEEAGKAPSRIATWFWNILTGIVLLLALAIFARRCGVIKF